jgi:hypothetical protein
MGTLRMLQRAMRCATSLAWRLPAVAAVQPCTRSLPACTEPHLYPIGKGKTFRPPATCHTHSRLSCTLPRSNTVVLRDCRDSGRRTCRPWGRGGVLLGETSRPRSLQGTCDQVVAHACRMGTKCSANIRPCGRARHAPMAPHPSGRQLERIRMKAPVYSRPAAATCLPLPGPPTIQVRALPLHQARGCLTHGCPPTSRKTFGCESAVWRRTNGGRKKRLRDMQRPRRTFPMHTSPGCLFSLSFFTCPCAPAIFRLLARQSELKSSISFDSVQKV